MKCEKCNGTGKTDQVEYTPPFEMFIGICQECNGKGFKAKGITKEIVNALLDAKSVAMKNTIAARIPECGDFGGIAQNLAYVCEQLGITDS